MSQEGQREREKETLADSVLSTEPDGGLCFTTLRSPPKLEPRVRCLNYWATQISLYLIFKPIFIFLLKHNQERPERTHSTNLFFLNNLFLCIVYLCFFFNFGYAFCKNDIANVYLIKTFKFCCIYVLYII